MSTSNENDLICGSIDKEVTPEIPETLETSGITETPENLESSIDRKSTRLNSSHSGESRMPSSA